MLPDALFSSVMEHALAELPREACGVITVEDGIEHYRACRNVGIGKDQFVIAPEDWAAAEDAGTIAAIVHSHPYAQPTASEADRVGCEKSGLPWIIVSQPNRTWSRIEPCGYRAPLLGRPFHWGTLDCYALIRDYYREALAIDLPDFPRTQGWEARGENLFVKHFAEASFIEVGDALRLHDVLLMQVGADTPNHGAIWLGDGLILQHLINHLSARDVYGGYWRKCTVKQLRHQSLV